MPDISIHSSTFRRILGALCCAMLTECATTPEGIAPAPVAMDPYLQLDCSQLAIELARVAATLRDAEELQAGIAHNDSAAIGIAGIIFTPAIMAMRGDGPMAAEVARLKGERIAIIGALKRKSCPSADQR